QKLSAQDSINAALAYQKLTRYLLLPDDEAIRLALPDSVPFFEITYKEAVKYAYDNSESIVRFRLNRLEAEQAVARTSAESNLKFNIRANFGLSNRADVFSDLFN